MDAELKLNKIFSQVQKLNKAEQASLLKKLTQLLKSESKAGGKPVTLADLSGLGSTIWQNMDIDKYVNDERQW